MANGTFKLNEIERLAKEVAKKARFPIRSSDELIQALGGENASLSYEGKSHKPAEARQIPPDVFPIDSEGDFVAKMATLRAAKGDRSDDLPRGQEITARPAEAGEPPKIPDGDKVRGRAGYKGYKTRR